MDKTLLNNKEWLEEQLKNGIRQIELAKQFGVDRSTVRRAIDRFDLHKYSKRSHTPLLDDKEWLAKELQTKTFRQIAMEIGASVGNVADRAYRYGLATPEKDKSNHIKQALKLRYPEGRVGKETAHWKGGRAKCIDCGKELQRYGATRCDEHNGLHRSGKNNTNWQGGITPINASIRASKDMKNWRKAVFERDDYTCQDCGIRSGNGKAVILHADHIKTFALYPALRFAIDNGKTLCIDCHKKTDTYAGRIRNYKP